MGFLFASIILFILSLVLSFLFSVTVAGWIVWVSYAIISVTLFIQSFTRYNSMLRGEPKSRVDVMGIASFPFITSVMGIVLIVFLFVDLNKLHLLWIYPVVAMIFEFTVGRRAVKIMGNSAPDPRK